MVTILTFLSQVNLWTFSCFLSVLALYALSVLCTLSPLKFLQHFHGPPSIPFWLNYLNPGSLLSSTHLFLSPPPPHMWNQLPHPLQSFLPSRSSTPSSQIVPNPKPWSFLPSLIPHWSNFPVFPPWSFPLYQSCPPHASSAAPYSSPHPLFVQVSLDLGL